MKTLFLFFCNIRIFTFTEKNNIIKEPFKNPDEKIFKSCGNKYLIDYNLFKEPENGLYTEILKMKYKEFGNFKDDIPICYEEIHPRNDKERYDYFNSNLLEDPMDIYSKPGETHKPILYGFDVSEYRIR